MTCAGVFFAMALVVSGKAAERAPLDVGNAKQLFIDDLFFETSQNVSLRLHPPRKTGERNVQRDKPWESATLNWFSVIGDDDRYRMWYECYDVEGWPTGDDTSFCYADSEDGVVWTKPELGLFSYRGSSANNILFRMIGPEGAAHSRVHGTGVFNDPQAPPEHRYKAVSQGLFSDRSPPHRIAGMVSPDGLRWTRHPVPVCDVFADSQFSCFWDESLRKLVLYGRVGGNGRAIGRSASGQFAQFEPLELVLQTDENDPPESDLYNPAALKYPYAANVYLMFPSLFRHREETLDIRLAVSRDGVRWTWPERNVPFIPLGKPGAFDGGSLYMGQGMIAVGNELWQYYGGSPLKHNESKLDNLAKPGNSRIYSRVVSRQDGFVSADAGPAGGHFITPPLLFTGDCLRLNVQVQMGGQVRVGLLDERGEPLPGRSIQDCLPITGDHVDVPVRWKSGTSLPARTALPTQMRVEMVSASLYAFQFAADEPRK